MRALPLMVAVAIVSACGSSSDDSAAGAASGERASAPATRIERCVDRLLERAASPDVHDARARRYTRDTYCARFESNGWLYDDGALKIAAYVAFEEGGECATATAGEPSRTVPCDQLEAGVPRRLECALLGHVRRSEVGDYLERLQRDGPVACDDGTPLAELGVP